jgi:hypothetical protein
MNIVPCHPMKRVTPLCGCVTEVERALGDTVDMEAITDEFDFLISI